MEYFYYINRIYTDYIFRTIPFTKYSHLHYLILGYSFMMRCLITERHLHFKNLLLEINFSTGHKNNENT